MSKTSGKLKWSWECGCDRRDKEYIETFNGEFLLGNRNVRQLRNKWQCNITKEVKEMRCEDQRWMELAQVSD